MPKRPDHTENLLQPAGAIEVHARGVDKVSGTQFFLQQLDEEGISFRVLIKREPRNRVDPYAIRVLVKTSGSRKQRLVGYLSAPLARTLAKKMDAKKLNLGVFEARIVGGGERGYRYGLVIVLFDRDGQQLRHYREIAKQIAQVAELKKTKPQRAAVERLRRERQSGEGR